MQVAAGIAHALAANTMLLNTHEHHCMASACQPSLLGATGATGTTALHQHLRGVTGHS